MLRDAHAFEAERHRTTLLAYRMCGSWADAEDVVQQVAIEWLNAPGLIENPAGWLTKATVRRSLDRLRARQRDASYLGPWLPEPLVETTSELPHEAAAQTDALSTAFLVLAEHLTPPQRAVIVLRALDYSHTEIADLLDITPAASRQHHTRGSRRVADLDGRSADNYGLEADDAVSAESMLQAFLTAARLGDVDTLATLLHDEIQAFQDSGGKTRAARRILVGVTNVAHFTVGVAGLHVHWRTARFVSVNGAPGAVLTLSGITHVLSVQVRDGRIYRLFDVCNPDKLRLPLAESKPSIALAG